jgi:hypothetical protein
LARKGSIRCHTGSHLLWMAAKSYACSVSLMLVCTPYAGGKASRYSNNEKTPHSGGVATLT